MDEQTQERCLTVSPEDVLKCGDDLQGLRTALADAQLSPDERKTIDTGLGLPAEGRSAEEAACWLRQCPDAIKAGVRADDIEATCAAATATEDAIAGMTDFQTGARHTAAVFGSALVAVYQGLTGSLRERLAGGSLSDEERNGLQADLLALTVPMDNEDARAGQAQLRADRRIAELRTEAEEAQDQAQADLEYFSALDALHRGEELPPEALQRMRNHERAALHGPSPTAPRKGRRSRR